MLDLRHELLRLPAKRRGLGVMTIGFLVACFGAAVAFGIALLFEQLPSELRWVGSGLGFFGWFVLICGMVVTAVGILMHWAAMFGGDEE